MKKFSHHPVVWVINHCSCWPKYTLKGIQGEDQDVESWAYGKLLELALRFVSGNNFMNWIFASSYT